VNAKYRADNTYRLDRTSLHFAAAAGYQAVAEVLLAHKADVNARDAEGHTPLHLAVRVGNGLVERLLNSGADANAQNNSGVTVLSQAVSWRQTENVRKLLAAKADPNGGKTDLPAFACRASRETQLFWKSFRAGSVVDLRDELSRHPCIGGRENDERQRDYFWQPKST
jgi:ankyrin repeat protein